MGIPLYSEEVEKSGSHDVSMAATDTSKIRHRIDAWLKCGFARHKARSILRHLVAIEVGDEDFNQNAMLGEEEFRKIRESVEDPKHQDGLIVLPEPGKFLNDSSDLERAASVMAGTCLTFLLFDEDTKKGLPNVYLYAAEYWAWNSEDFWKWHSHDFYETRCGLYTDDQVILNLTVRFLSDEEKRQSSLRVAYPMCSTFEKTENPTPLHFAARYDLEKVVSVLLENPSFDINARTAEGKTALDIASRMREKRTLVILLSQPGINPETFYISHEAEIPGVKVIEMNLRNPVVPRSLTALHLAAMHNLPEVLGTFLKAPGVDVNAQDALGRTPLFYAAGIRGARTGVLQQMLLAPDVNVDRAIACGESVLREQIEKAMKETSLHRSPLVASDLTPLHLAAMLEFECRDDCRDTFLTLLKRPDVNINAQDSLGRTPIWYAAGCKTLDRFKLLLAMPDIDLSLACYSGILPNREVSCPNLAQDVIEDKREQLKSGRFRNQAMEMAKVIASKRMGAWNKMKLWSIWVGRCRSLVGLEKCRHV